MVDFKLIEWFDTNPCVELFNLAIDAGESRNLANEEPGRRDDLLRRLREWRHAVGAQEITRNPGYDPAAPTVVLPPESDRRLARIDRRGNR